MTAAKHTPAAPARESTVSDAALAFARDQAARIFKNRRGHGNARATERHLSELQVAGLLAYAFDAGREHARRADAAAPALVKALRASGLSPEWYAERARAERAKGE